MKYNIMFRNGDGVTLEGNSHQTDENYLRIFGDGKHCMKLTAVFSWDAIVGFVIKEDSDGKR